MTVTEYKYPIPKPLCGRRAVALGFFDGVHVGHRALLHDCVRWASRTGLIPTVLTFPSEALGIKSGAKRLYSTEEKLRLLEECGIMQTIVVDFDSVATLSPKDFVTRVLFSDLGADAIFVGADFRFGHRAAGNATLLEDLARGAGSVCRVHDMEAVTFPTGESIRASATLIRECLESGDICRANTLLGAPYRIRGRVLHGRGEGTGLGYPTINTDIDPQSPLKRGVYRTTVVAEGGRYTALTNIGTCPTFEERKVHAETYILDFSGDLYGVEVVIELHEFIREERSFDSPEALTDEIKRNIEYILKTKEI